VSGDGGGAAGALGSIGKKLATALEDQPVLAALLLVGVIGAIALLAIGIFSQSSTAIIAFFLLLAMIVVFIFVLARQPQTLRGPVAHSTPMDLARNLSQEDRDEIRGALQGAAESVAAALGVGAASVRSNLFALDTDGRLRIVPELTYNMKRADELTISMPIGYGSNGRAYKSKKPNYALFETDWDVNAIEEEELAKVDPALRWIISVPILGKSRVPIWIFNIDGMEGRDETHLRQVLSEVLYWVEVVSLIAMRVESGG